VLPRKLRLFGGDLADEGGLYLRISADKSSGKRWVFVYRRPGDRKRCKMGSAGWAWSHCKKRARTRLRSAHSN